MTTTVETRGRTLEEMSRLFGIESSLAERSGIKLATEEHIEDTHASTSNL